MSISTETFHVKDGKADVCYIIEDDGIGMSDEFQKRLFQPFHSEIARSELLMAKTRLDEEVYAILEQRLLSDGECAKIIP